MTTDRYTGVYSGGEWIAFALHPAEIPLEPFDDDCTAAGYWCGGEVNDGTGSPTVLGKDDELHPRFVGLGKTIEEAIADLNRKRGPKVGKRGKPTKA